MPVGIHILAELHGCPKEKLETVSIVKPLLQRVASESKFNVVGEFFHQFDPFGVTGVLVLSESHMSIHTWPEKRLAVIDIFTCGVEGNAQLGFERLCEHFTPARFKKKVVRR